ncbi:hypothetical protein ATKI12_6173 [Kitasatospora sp. Ki12]
MTAVDRVGGRARPNGLPTSLFSLTNFLVGWILEECWTSL